MSADLPMAELQTVTLEQVRVGVQQYLSLETLRDTAQIEACTDAVAQQLAYRLEAHVLAEHLPPEEISRSERVEFEVPASWWQHFKADHGHRWWLRRLVNRRPVRTRTLGRTVNWNVSLERYWEYPQAQSLPADRFGSPVRIHTISAWSGHPGPHAST